MFPKSRRLSHRDFTQLRGQTLSFPHFSLRHSPYTPGRLAIVTSAKLSKSAVIRNRLRRQIYSCFPEISSDIILYPRSTMLKLSRDQIRSEINSALSSLPH